MKRSYYPGCSLEVTARPYDRSFRQVCQTLGVEPVEVPEWICCGSSSALKMDPLFSRSLAAQTLALVEKQALESAVVPCPFCYRRLISARKEIKANPRERDHLERILETSLECKTPIHNLLEFFVQDLGTTIIQARIQKPLTGMKLVPYYGCYLVKPPQVTGFDHPENPTSMDEILQVLGAEVLDWDFKTECCGASLSISKTETVRALSRRLIAEARWKGAEAIVVVCQLCQANLDLRQGDDRKDRREGPPIPVLYLTQVMGLAFGHPLQALGLDKHVVDPAPLLLGKGFGL